MLHGIRRDATQAPALFALEGANIGFQLGGQATDFVLLVMNPKGANSIMMTDSSRFRHRIRSFI